MIFICENKDCEKCGQEQNFTRVSYKLVDGHLKASCVCPSCKKDMFEVPNDIPLSQKNLALGEYSSLNREGRIEMLKKRSHEHFDKKIKPYKDHMNDRLKKELMGK